MELAQALTGALERLLAAGPVEVQEDGTWVAALEQFRYETREQGDVLLLHLWSGERNIVRRVLRISREAPGRLSLEVSRFGRARPGKLEFVALENERPSQRIRREQFRARLRDLLGQQFPDEKIASLAASADLEHSLSGNYARGVLVTGRKAWAVLGAAPGEGAAACDALLTFGLLWLDHTRQFAQRQIVAGLRLFFPEGTGAITAHRMQALSGSICVELYEYSTETWRVRRVDPGNLGNLETWLVPRRDVESVLAQAQGAIDQIRELALKRASTGAPTSAARVIVAEVVPGTCEIVFRYRGLVFARWQAGKIFYGAGDPREPLTTERETNLARLLQELETYRAPAATNTKHALYRAQPERWLESLVAADPTRVDARLDPRFLYAQVPAFSAGDRGVMDLLGITRDARLAVIELKANEDIQLVMQGVDYWLRVRWHHAQEDFSRYGYFPGISLDPRPPLLFLVAPALRFHPAGDVMMRYLHPEIEICRVGVSESWRRALKVVLRQGRG